MSGLRWWSGRVVVGGEVPASNGEVGWTPYAPLVDDPMAVVAAQADMKRTDTCEP